MKNILTIGLLLSFLFTNAQAFTGKEDSKFQVGANFQHNATSINVTYDYGLGENFSVGVVSSYALGIPESVDASFDNRFDLKARFNANIGSVLNIDENFDFYPGLSFSLKNFGGHAGARYFFSDGFGVFTEVNFPIAKYKSGDLTPAQEIHNQFTVGIGTVFNL
ncbi:hypothetical protein EGM88_08250 [Aureibaculum marinum]|uniref:Outer membrane protein beta-barrel domain-containing protein n=1 Tax=Aureibaculum marinum TaxID=2487930 RepID=A0A3N4P1R1_9FLAO|nr:DUF6646 family protein [Aureibaculum marinum]RPD97769.1 hypothetical protein EGM88_08250 [Aureibaculum marinum]